MELIPDLIDNGIDILNPVQISARGMDARKLKQEFGDDIVFWGGGIDTQKTLPFFFISDAIENVEPHFESVSFSAMGAKLCEHLFILFSFSACFHLLYHGFIWLLH